MNKLMAATLIAGVVLSGCAGSPPNPVMTQQLGDKDKSCQSMQAENASIQQRITELRQRQSTKNVTNGTMAIAGVFLLVPWFFMDLHGSEQAEIDAYRQRQTYLTGLMADRDCKAS